MLKHYARLIDIEVTNDKKLYSQNLHKLKNLLKLQSFQMPFVVFENAVEIFYKTTIPWYLPNLNVLNLILIQENFFMVNFAHH
jgi:hypothetical protein